MTSYVTPKINTEYIFYVGLQSQADTKLLQANPTLATGDVKVSIDGGAFANLGTLPAITPASGKGVKVTLSAAEMNGDNITVLFSDAAGDEWCDLLVSIQTTANQVDDLATVSAILAAVIETGLTLKNALRLVSASTAGKLSGADTVTNVIRNAVADDKNRITATVDEDGNRTAITYDLTD